MRFKKKFWKNSIECDAGFSVRILDRYHLRYYEQDCNITISVEYIGFWWSVILSAFFASQYFWAGNGERAGTVVEGEELKKIVENIRAAFRSQDKEIDVYYNDALPGTAAHADLHKGEP